MRNVDWNAVAAWLGAIAAWIPFVINEFRRSADARLQVAGEYVTHAWARRRMWSAIREAYGQFLVDHSSAPPNLDTLIDSAAMPPNLVGATDLPSWPTSNVGFLNANQRLLWDFCTSVYPPRSGHIGDVMTHSSIAAGNRESFHESRNQLSRFWEIAARRVPPARLAQDHTSAHRDFLLLSWLELALSQWTQDQGPGNQQLFAIAAAVGR